MDTRSVFLVTVFPQILHLLSATMILASPTTNKIEITNVCICLKKKRSEREERKVRVLVLLLTKHSWAGAGAGVAGWTCAVLWRSAYKIGPSCDVARQVGS